MTQSPSTLSVAESEESAASCMRLRRVRRVPLVDGERLVGLVTLDDFDAGKHGRSGIFWPRS